MNHSLFSLLISLLKSESAISAEQLRGRLKLSKQFLDTFVRYLQSLGLTLTQNDKSEYFLLDDIEPLSAEFLEKELSIWPIDILSPFLTLDSTNQYLKNTKSKFSENSRLCLAEYQSSGRGRQSKAWVAPIAKNIILSLHTRLKISPIDASGLSLVTGISIVNALNELGIEDLKIKWPNDLVWQDKKLAGILIESTKLKDGCVELIVGIGINVHMHLDEGKEIDQSWIDLAGITGKQFSRNVVIVKLVNHLLINYSLYEENGLDSFMSQWQSMDYLFKKNIIVTPSQSGENAGEAIGINERGELLMRTVDKVVNLVAGEISVRKRL